MLTETQIERYSRQIILAEVGGRGQERLLAATVVVIGTGAIARAIAPYLAGAGIGRLYLCPAASDELIAANELATDLADLNPDTRIVVTAAMAGDWAAECDVVIETTGEVVALRQAISAGRPLIAAGVVGSDGWLAASAADQGGACVGCVALTDRADAEEAECESPATGVIGALLVLEVLKRLLGIAVLPPGCWLRYDGATAALTEGPIVRQRACAVCSAPR